MPDDWAIAYLNIHVMNKQTILRHKFDQFWLILLDFLAISPLSSGTFIPL